MRILPLKSMTFDDCVNATFIILLPFVCVRVKVGHLYHLDQFVVNLLRRRFMEPTLQGLRHMDIKVRAFVGLLSSVSRVC